MLSCLTDNQGENSIKAVRTDAFAELKFLKQYDTAVKFKRPINVTCQQDNVAFETAQSWVLRHWRTEKSLDSKQKVENIYNVYIKATKAHLE